MELNTTISTILSVAIALGSVIAVVLFGWFVVWKMFLVRITFIHELVYGSNGNNNKKVKKKTEPATPLRRSSRIRHMNEAKDKTR